MSLYIFRALDAHLPEDTLYTCSMWYCHSLREFMAACRQTVHRQAATNCLQSDSTLYSIYKVCPTEDEHLRLCESSWCPVGAQIE